MYRRSMVVGLALLWACPALAHGHGPPLEHIATQLNLDAATKRQIKAIIDNTRAEARALRQQVHQAREAVRQLLEQDAPQEAQVLAKVDAESALMARLHRLRIKTLLRVHQLLTPQQRQTLRDLRKNRRKVLESACAADLAKRCPGAKGRKAMHCLFGARDKLSDACRKAMPPPPPRHGPHGPPPHGPPPPF